MVLTVAVAAVLLRSAWFVFFEANFDSDQALIGLMAKHISEGRVFPLFTYGQNYNLAVEAWMAAPLFWLAGPSVAMLKLPLMAFNVAIVVLLIVALEKELELRPALGLVAASFFILAPPGTSKYFVEASGTSIEPFLVVLLLWVTRHRPLLFGIILALGFLHREFVAYGLSALLLIEAANGSLFSWAMWRHKLAAVISFGAVWHLVQLVKPFSTVLGPGTSLVAHGDAAPYGAITSGQVLNLTNLLRFFCWDPAMALANLGTLFREYLGVLLGAVPRPLDQLFIDSQLSQGAPGLWLVLGSTLLFAMARIGWISVKGHAPPWRGHLQSDVPFSGGGSVWARPRRVSLRQHRRHDTLFVARVVRSHWSDSVLPEDRNVQEVEGACAGGRAHLGARGCGWPRTAARRVRPPSAHKRPEGAGRLSRLAEYQVRCR